MRKILFVDDEQRILRSLKRMLMDTDCELYLADSGQNALDMLKENPDIDLIISDMRMPVMDGYQLLSKVKADFPQVERIILSAYADKEMISRALQENVAKSYLLKPWDSREMMDQIQEIFRVRDLLKMPVLSKSLKESLGNIIQTSERPGLFRLTGACKEQDQLLEEYPSLCCDLLAGANEAFCDGAGGCAEKVRDYIGRENFRPFVLILELMTGLKNQGLYEEQMKSYCEYAFLCNRLYSFIYKEFLGQKTDEIMANTAALSHRIGIPFMLRTFGQAYERLLQSAVLRPEGKPATLRKLEEQTFGFNHFQAGAYVLDFLDFPYSFIEAALYGDADLPQCIANKEVVYMTRIAAYYAAEILGRSRGGDIEPQLFHALKIKRAALEERIAGQQWLKTGLSKG